MRGSSVFSADKTAELRCDACGFVASLVFRGVSCPDCGDLLDIIHPLPFSAPSALKELFATRSGLSAPGDPPENCSGVWRYAELVFPGVTDAAVSFPEGNTPLLRRQALDSWTGISSLLLKHEGQNPSGSFKDRGMSVAMTRARQIGADSVLCASTGNTSSSMALYAGLAGIRPVVLLPKGKVSGSKLAQTMAYGAQLFQVRGDFDDCLRLAREAEDRGSYLVNSVNPFRIEGQKTIVFELLQQLGWTPPDWIVLPAGNLGNASAFGKALRECLQLGMISRMPRLLLVQAAGAAPFAQSFRDDFASRTTVRADTVATAIQIGNPASFSRGVRAIRETNGQVLAVSDAEIVEAKFQIDSCGVGCEPASAASVAGVRKAVQSQLIRRGDSVVAILTGHLLKHPTVEHFDAEGMLDGRIARSREISPDIESFLDAMLSSGA